MTYTTLRYDVSEAGVATIALDQPDTRNALSDELLGELIAALQSARDDAGGPLRRAHLDPRESVLLRRQPRRICCRGSACPQALRHRAVPAAVHADRSARQAVDLRGQRSRACGRAGDRARVRPDHRARGRAVRDARDQRRRVPIHDHGADLPQRAPQEDQRAAVARRADLSRGGAADRDRQPASSRRPSSRTPCATGPRSSLASRQC